MEGSLVNWRQPHYAPDEEGNGKPSREFHIPVNSLHLFSISVMGESTVLGKLHSWVNINISCTNGTRQKGVKSDSKTER